MVRKSLSDILGGKTQFGDYEVLGEGGYNPKGRYAVCRCKCGVVKEVGCDKLRSGRSTCCKACAARSDKRITNLKHGMSGSAEYGAWGSLMSRCTNPKDMHYSLYGGRGITVCDSWKAGFEAFFADMGLRPSGRHSIDRIDNEKGYEPGNCRWALPVEQSANRRRTLKVKIGDEEVPTSMLARESGMSPATLAARIKWGWSLHEALSKPVENRKPKHNVHGEMMTASEIEAAYGIVRQTLNRRLRQGKTVLEAIEMG